MTTITREHEICMGHRVYGHESKCSNLHGHNYIFHFVVAPKAGLDSVGRVADFSEIKNVFCEWLEKEWDHKFLVWERDPLYSLLVNEYNDQNVLDSMCIVKVPFNPTAENIAKYFLEIIAPVLTLDRQWYLKALKINETSKCSAFETLNEEQETKIGKFQPLVRMPVGYYCSKQCGMERNCLCDGKSDEYKKSCFFCNLDLPF